MTAKVTNIIVSDSHVSMALEAMRAPMQSYKKSDSDWMEVDAGQYWFVPGQKDAKLLKTLTSNGQEHRKVLRMIPVSFTLTAPLFMLKELDQYKVGVTSSSESTIHRIHTNPITRADFSFDGIKEGDRVLESVIDSVVRKCESLRQEFNITHDAEVWRALITLMPASWNQTRYYSMNLEVALQIVRQRTGHKLHAEWSPVIKAFYEELPLLHDILTDKEKADVENYVYGKES